MFKIGIFTALLGLLLSHLALAEDLPRIEVVGNKFFYSNNGSQFYIRGIAYQQNVLNQTDTTKFEDPLKDGDACKRDVEYLQQARTNVLRVYALDTKANHDECMKTFEDAGIYIMADLSEPSNSINRQSPSWNLDLYERYTQVIDMMGKYSNVMGFFAGNEVTNNKSNTDASAFVKAAVRDTKKYIAKKKYGSIPVGYASNDDDAIRIPLANYFACGDDEERADFYGINTYEWCGDSDFKSSGYEARTEEYKNLSIPLFFSEYGCNAKRPRQFTEVGTLFGDKMTDIWSGGIVYMYFEEENEYGLVSVDGDKVKTLGDFSYYSKQINSVSPSAVKSSAVQSASATLECPASGSTWKASTKLPPTPNKEVCDCLSKSLECVLSDDVDEEDYGDLYGQVCAEAKCDDIASDGAKGKYGPFSYCSEKEKLSYILNAYYEDQDKSESACSWKGSASLKKGAKTDKSCKTLMSKASSGSLDASDSDSGSGDSSSESGSSSGTSSSDSEGSGSSSTRSSSGHLRFDLYSKSEMYGLMAIVTCFTCGLSFILA